MGDCSLPLGGKKYKVVQAIGAGQKFDNYSPCVFEASEKKGVIVEEPVYYVVTQKSSGCMARVAPVLGPDGKLEKNPRLFILTKNGSDERYIQTIKRVLDEQMGSKLQWTLCWALSLLEWSLNMEVVTKEIDSVEVDGVMRYGEICAHGSIPRTDHAIIHGGMKKDNSIVTPVDLMVLFETVRALLVEVFVKERELKSSPVATSRVLDLDSEIEDDDDDDAITDVEKANVELRGLYIAGCFGFDANEEGAKPLIDAFESVKNNILCPVIRTVAPCELDMLPSEAPYVAHGDEYFNLFTGLKAKLVEKGMKIWRHEGNHSTVGVDTGKNFEGYVVHELDETDILNDVSWKLLKTCRNPVSQVFDPSMIQPNNAVVNAFLKEFESQVSVGDIDAGGYSAGVVPNYSLVPISDKITLENFLPCCDGELQHFL